MKFARQDFPLRGFEENRLAIPGIDGLTDDELSELNQSLPWYCFVADSHGRRFGAPASPTKRNQPQVIPDRRITLLNERVDLADKTVLEVGCFEGIHTVGLLGLAKGVAACDGRIVNVVKTAVRCAMFQVAPRLFVWDVEKPIPEGQDPRSDVLFHIGVLYHLLDPLAHLERILPLIGGALLLDTHYATGEMARDVYAFKGTDLRCHTYREKEHSDPFSGMYATSRWLLLDDIAAVLRDLGMTDVDIIEKRDERNGPRVLMLATR